MCWSVIHLLIRYSCVNQLFICWSVISLLFICHSSVIRLLLSYSSVIHLLISYSSINHLLFCNLLICYSCVNPLNVSTFQADNYNLFGESWTTGSEADCDAKPHPKCSDEMDKIAQQKCFAVANDRFGVSAFSSL